MDVDLLITELEVGGAEKCLTSLAEYLHHAGHRVRVISIGSRPIGKTASLVERLESKSIELHFLNGTRWRQLPRIYRELRRLVQKRRPDVAQSFLFHANVVGAMVYPKQKVPLLGGARVAEPRRWRHRIDRMAAHRMTRFVCVSHSVAKWCREVERIAPEKLEVIPNGIQVTSVNRSPDMPSIRVERQWKASDRLCLFVGRLDHQKGVDRLLTMADRLLKRLSHARLVVMGDGPLRSSVEQAIERSPYCERFHNVGWQPNPRDWMAEADLLLLPARYEGMPNVVLEAMAEGRAIACTRVEGIEEVLGEQTSAQTVDGQDVEGFEQLVIRLTEDDRWRTQIGQANRERAMSEFSLESCMRRYEELMIRLARQE